MKIISLTILLSLYAFTSFADDGSIYNSIQKNDIQKKSSQDVFSPEYDASKIKKKSRMQQTNKKLLDGKLKIEEEAKKKYGEDGFKSPRALKEAKEQQKKKENEERQLIERFKTKQKDRHN